MVDRHGTNRHGAVTDNPVARGVDVFASAQIHHGVGAPADSPHQFFHFLFNAAGHRAIADVGIDFGAEVTANNHGLHFGVVDVGGNNGAATGDFVAYKLRGDDFRDLRAHAIAFEAHFAVQIGLVFGHPFALAVFTQGNVFHLGRDDALARIVHLRHIGASFGAARLALQGSGFLAQLLNTLGITLVQLATIVQNMVQTAFVGFGIAARLNPCAAGRGQTVAHVDSGSGVGVGA